MNSNRRDFALQVVRTLRDAGFQALWAGGCVRDLILGVSPSDYDVATDAVPEAVMRLFRRTVPVGLSFGVVRVLGAKKEAGEVEVATFRSDGQYLDGRRPESVRFGSPQEDAARRDFTINGMFLDPLTDAIIDYVGGREDLRRGVIRAIGNPRQRFDEDKLRLLRAIRFTSRFSFDLETQTRDAIASMADQVVVVAAERITQELRKMLGDANRARGVGLAYDLKILAAIFPELRAFQQTADPECPERDLWSKTLAVLSALPERGTSFALALAALLGDAGIVEENDVAFSARLADQRCQALKLPNAERDRVVWLIANRRALDEPGTLPESRLKRRLASPGIGELLALNRAERQASGASTDAAEFCENYLRNLPQGPIDPPPLLTGKDLIAHGMKPGPEFSRWLEQVRDAQLDRVIETRAEALAYLDRMILERP
jgi:poly(A) polymerase